MSTRNLTLSLDAMGGDNAPGMVVDGISLALARMPHVDFLLFGDEKQLIPLLDKTPSVREVCQVRHTEDTVSNDEKAGVALRSGRNSSMRLAINAVNDGEAAGIVSAGNTGAFVAAAQMHMRRLPGVARPGIAAVVPTFGGPVTFIDVGANIDPKPHHLHQYGVMGTVYARRVLGIENPRVGLMNVGSEEQKGTDDMKRAREALRDDPTVDFVGYVEGRGVFDGHCDVVVSDGVTGNVTIKLTEGLSSGIFRRLKQELGRVDPSLSKQFAPIVETLYAEYDYHEYGGAPLMGVNGGCLICHGSSKARTITNALAAARRFVDLGVNARIVEILANQQVEA